MAARPRRTFNATITGFWNLAAPLYDLPVLQRQVYQPPQDQIVALLADHGARRIADVGCGTGILADRIKRELDPAAAYGVDMSEGMLEQARARSSAVQWLRGPAEQLPFDDGALEAVVSTSAFHFFDQPAALAEFHRVLVPGGVAAVATFAPPLAVAGALTERLSPAHSPGRAELRTMFETAGFTVTSQDAVPRPVWTRLIVDRITVGVK
ncbi:class I SAM-dependent methyltransferase [Mycolicibacterium thermoresistibile]